MKPSICALQVFVIIIIVIITSSLSSSLLPSSQHFTNKTDRTVPFSCAWNLCLFVFVSQFVRILFSNFGTLTTDCVFVLFSNYRTLTTSCVSIFYYGTLTTSCVFVLFSNYGTLTISLFYFLWHIDYKLCFRFVFQLWHVDYKPFIFNFYFRMAH